MSEHIANSVMVRWMSGLVTGLQNRLQRFESASDLHTKRVYLTIHPFVFMLPVEIYYGGAVAIGEGFVGNDDGGSARGVVGEVFQQLLLGRGVERACRLIHQQHRTLTQQGSGDGYALCLTFA